MSSVGSTGTGADFMDTGLDVEAGLPQTMVHLLYLEQATDAAGDLLAGWEE